MSPAGGPCPAAGLARGRSQWGRVQLNRYLGAITIAAGCASAPRPAKPPPPSRAPVVEPQPAPDAGAAPIALEGENAVQVRGLEGTLQAFDVNDTMERRLDALSACQRQRIRHVRHLAGTAQLAIHVRADGEVGHVDIIHSDVGDYQTERCIAQVTQQTTFPAPHGGEARVKWSMALEPISKRTLQTYEPDELAEALALGLPDLSGQCRMHRRSPRLLITAYVAPTGKVITAGASSKARGKDDLLACATSAVAAWTLPRRKGVAKVQFQVRYRPPLTQARRNALQKKYAQLRKAASKRKKSRPARAKAKRQRRQRRPR